MRTAGPARGPLSGELEVPGDKSIGHRALMLGAIAEGALRVKGLPDGQDVRSTRRVLEGLGADVRDEGKDVLVRGKGIERPFRAASAPLDCGNSGTTMRLMMGLLAGQGFESALIGDESLSRRPMRRVAEPLSAMGARFELSEGSHAPVKVLGRRPLKAIKHRLALPSAQVKSALLLAGLWADGVTEIEDPFDSRDHTERMLSWLGPEVLRREGRVARVTPGPLRSDRELVVPGDPSSAAYFLAAAALVPGSAVTVRGVAVNPARIGFVETLREMGAPVAIEPEGGGRSEPAAALTVRHSGLRAVVVRAERVPALVDEIPLLAVVAARAEGETRIEGAGELRLKESDRLEGTADNLRRMGADARAEGDALIVRGPARLKGARVETLGDHRLAMAFTIAALTAEGDTTLSDAECAAVSYPGFYDALRRIGG